MEQRAIAQQLRRICVPALILSLAAEIAFRALRMDNHCILVLDIVSTLEGKGGPSPVELRANEVRLLLYILGGIYQQR